MDGSPIIQAEDLSVRFGDFTAVSHLTFDVLPGEIFGLIGPSGSGKTTTIRLLTGNVPPTEGRARALGTEPRHFKRATREQIGYLTQHFVLYPDLTLYANLNFVASIYGMGWLQRRRQVRRTLEFVELWDRRNVPAAQASGGMRKRLGLAGALVHDPTLVFLDEPTAGIDPVLRSKFWNHFQQLKGEGRTLFVTTQYVTEAEYCYRVAVLNEGELVAVGTPRQLRQWALEGEQVDVRAPGLGYEQALRLYRVPGVRGVHPHGPGRARVVVEEAARAIPEIVRALEQAGVGAPRVEEVRPNFDEVFVAVTLMALSLVRERLLGAIELFRVAPVGPGELLFGKLLSYSFIVLGVAAALFLLLTFGLGIPLLGSHLLFVLTIMILILASLGVGMLIALISPTDSQAVQLTMLVLLTSVFFSGFFVGLDSLVPWVRSLSYAIPATYAILALQDIMLRSRAPDLWTLGVPAALALGLFALSALLFRRQFCR